MRLDKIPGKSHDVNKIASDCCKLGSREVVGCFMFGKFPGSSFYSWKIE